MNRVSVIIPAYNSQRTIKQCVESVLANDYSNFEVIVVDDCSGDDTRNIMQDINDQRLKFIINEKNSGAAFSRNRAISEASGELILLLDSDAYAGKDWIATHVKLHSELDADIIGGGVIGIYQTVYGRCDCFSNWWTSIPYSRDYYLERLHLPSINMSIKRAAFERIGNFNEELKTGEDAQFCFKALQNNLKIYFKSDIIVYHYDQDDLNSYLRHQENWGKHAIRMRKRLKMNYACVLPNSYLAAYFYIIPLAFLFTGFIIMKWLRYKPSVLLYAPVIFLGKIWQAKAIKNSLKP